MDTLILAYYITIFILGLPANLLALYAFSRKIHTKASPTDILLLNLTISDLLFLLCLPLKMLEAAWDMRWHLPEALCQFSTFIYYSTIYNSSGLLMAVSVDRNLCVEYAIWYRQHVRPLHGILASIVIWTLSLSHFTYLYVIEIMPNNSSVCYSNFSEAQLALVQPIRLELFVVFFVLPLLVSSFCYLRFVLVLSRVSHLEPGKRTRAIGMALGTLLVFVVCFLPYNLSHVLGYIQGVSMTWRDEVLLLTATNAIIDPIIFYFSSSTFQGNIWGVVSLVWRNGCCETSVCTRPSVEPDSGPTVIS
ncbi:free fatty acid receptor 2-like [Sardina pilchardus]|uniref:free fatty acid receptor 2-like n=1 Tax=Sardina pilchardus TaxID=27697 RepID=UPI002E161EE6